MAIQKWKLTPAAVLVDVLEALELLLVSVSVGSLLESELDSACVVDSVTEAVSDSVLR